MGDNLLIRTLSEISQLRSDFLERVYEEIREYSDLEVKDILERQIKNELLVLSLSVGMYMSDWKKRKQF